MRSTQPQRSESLIHTRSKRSLHVLEMVAEEVSGPAPHPIPPPGAFLFATLPIPFAVREPLPGTAISETPRPVSGLHSGCTATQLRSHTIRSKPQEPSS